MKKDFPTGILHVSCVDLSFEGRGICKNEGQVIFVDGMFPGEEGDIEIAYRRAGQLYGELKKLTKSSPSRIEPPCKVCHACGGCCFQQYAYPAQLDFKTAQVALQFHRIGHLEVQVQPCLGMDREPYFYRNKIQMPFCLGLKGDIYCGFYKENSHVIVPIEKCYIEDQRSEHILHVLRELMKKYQVVPYQEDSGTGILRHAIIKTSYYFKEIMVVLVTNTMDFPDKDLFVADLLKECPEITTLVENLNESTGSKVLGDSVNVLFGPGFINDKLGGLSFKLSAKSFYQTNSVMTEKLYKTAMDFAKLTPNDIVFDAYSGIGTIGLIAAKNVAKVISVEILPEAVEDAIQNAKDNGITNFSAYADDATSFINKMVKEGQHVDVLFMDPPRKGADERFLKALKSLKPGRVVYISCNPSTLARDCDLLSDTYKVSQVQPVDLFPQTHHVETVVRLTLRTLDNN